MFPSAHTQLDNESDARICRAIAARDPEAWAELASRYRLLLIDWARRYAARTPTVESCEDLADQALTRAWLALSSGQTRTFPTLAALLGYLRCCVSAAVIDQARASAGRAHAPLPDNASTGGTPEQEALDDFERAELWRLISRVVMTEQERVVLYEGSVLDLPSRAIHARHPELFDSVTDVYRVKRNIFSRLQRNPELRRFYRGEDIAA